MAERPFQLRAGINAHALQLPEMPPFQLSGKPQYSIHSKIIYSHVYQKLQRKWLECTSQERQRKLPLG